MITQFRVQNYKVLRNVTLDLMPMHVLIGPNSSGKTSILEALQALCRSVDYPLERAFIGAWKGRELVWRGGVDPIVSLGVSVHEDESEFKYDLKCRFETPQIGREVISSSETYRGTHEVPLRELFGGEHQGSFVYRMQNRHPAVRDSEEFIAVDRIHKVLSGVQVCRWDPRLLALPVAPDSSRRFFLAPSGFGLARCLDDLLGYDRELFNQMESRFRKVFPEIKSIKLLPEPAFRAAEDHTRATPLLEKSDGKGIYFQDERNPALVPATQTSDGVLIVLAYLTILSLPQPPRVILIEEPENGIHPKRLREVISILRDLVKERSSSQIILTTHSPYALDMFEPEEVTVCRQQDGETKVSRLSDSKTVRDQLDIFSLGEIWTAEGDDKIAASDAAGVPSP